MGNEKKTYQTDPPSSCEYIIRNDSVNSTVKIEFNNMNQNNYSVNLKENSFSSTAEKKDGNGISLEIPYNKLKPCHSYTVDVTPSCKGPKTFQTEPLTLAHIESREVRDTQLHLKTIWDWTKYIDIEENQSCTLQTLTFKGEACKSTINITIPPAMPEIIYTNEIPTMLKWHNKPPKCTNVTINVSCTSTGSQILNVDTKLPNETFQPFQAYSCSGIVKYGDQKPIKSDFQVNITCDVGGTINVEPTNSSIQTSWILDSDNCPKSNISAEVTCGGKTKPQGALKWTFADLHPYTSYECILKKMYNKHVVHREEKVVKTLPGLPELETPIRISLSTHNTIHVNCKIKKWHGEKGSVYAEVKLSESAASVPEVEKTGCVENKDCDFTFANLYHLSKYTVKVRAKNGNGNESIVTDSYSTKYNDKAVLGFLGFLIVLTSLALLFVLYKIYLLKKKQSRDEREMDDLLPPTTLLPVDPIPADALVETYKKKIADEGRLFMEEFQSIPRIFSNYTVKEAKKAENQSKNRYVDILPYDYNRVPLANGGRHDYINASFIEGYKESNKYIAAQGPKEETVGDFWRMTWEQNTSIIVMVTRCEEGNKNKCAQYWPSMERETEIFDDYVVKIKGEENCPDYIIRRLSVMNRKEKTLEREVTHIQFTSWPDHGVPGDPGLLLKLRRRVNSFKNVFSGPIVIHCSAGVGRTGTYICIDAMIESLEAEGRVDIYGYVAKLRRQRCLMVQVEAQYVLIHTALIEYNQFGETEISLTDFHSVVNTLRQKEVSEPSLLEMEFQKLPKFKNWRTSNTASTEENKKKNRNSSVVPYDFNRVLIKLEDDVSNGSDAEEDEDYSSDEEDETPTKYINASYLDGYWCPKGLIAAQGPLSDTVADFLQMLYQHRVKTVVMLSDCTENGQEFCFQYWNDEKKEFGEMVVEVKETETFPTYIRRSLEIQHTKRKESHTTEQYQFLKWVGNELPPNPCDLIDMMKSIRQNGGYKNSGENRGAPVVAHCNDGSSRSGIFCALWNILDSADTEKLVDVFQVSKHLRKERQGMITSLEQYQFLYAALEVAFPVQNGEVKKSAATPDTVQVINEQTALMSATSEDQEGAESSQQVEQKADAEATEAAKPAEHAEPTEPAKPTETTVTSESSEQTVKSPSESTTNGPAVSVEV
ncbi:hypothetical protein MHYP_G00221830 [Metynnis hypsauchen]